ncbi:extracellular solute-binding protein [Agromyces atrinae]|uniref:extracellular solute-binding protein n=1 Tax=Agromyces atrinae TaxID=592376 RepID=UPI001F5A57E1|nr:extracellular solute-binding protein [Agromyces atrinae]MCI2956533.1 extracellular solute-binding protein [Agromyces atrinae]
MRLPRLAVVALAAALALTGCATGPSTTPKADAGEGASGGGTDLVIYVGRNEDHVRPLVERFEEETGLTVDARYGSTGELATTILQEGDSSPADLFFTQDPAYIGAISEAGLLAPLPADIIGLVPEGISGAEDDWVGVTARRRVLAYDPATTPEAGLPGSVFELTDPAWSGRVGLAPTHSSFVSFVAAMVAIRGEDETLAWLEGIAANDPQIFDGNEEQLRAIAAGDLDVGLVNHYYVHRLLAEDPAFPVKNHSFDAGDPGDVLMPTTIGMLASTVHEEAALDFVRFLLSDESQRHFLGEVGEYPLVDGVGTPEGERPLDPSLISGMNLPVVAGNLDIATDLIARSGLI